MDLNDRIIEAWTKTCKKHKIRFNLLAGCPGCNEEILNWCNKP
jgi:hypothetical protein